MNHNQINHEWPHALKDHLLGTVFDRFCTRMETHFKYFCQQRDTENQSLFTFQIAYVGAEDTYLLATGQSEPKTSAVQTMLATFTFESEEEKAQGVERLAQRMVDERKMPVAIYLASETWISERRPTDPHVEPRLDPNRREGAMIIALTITHGHRAKPYEIAKKENGYRLVPTSPRTEEVRLVPHILNLFYRSYMIAIEKHIEQTQPKEEHDPKPQ